ncbi:MAG: hypothetical protein ACYC35_09620 [Pirellulales bacterium]
MKRLIAEAAERGEYSLVEKLAKWASGLGAMCSEEEHVARCEQKSTPSDHQGRTPLTSVLSHKTRKRATAHAKRRAYPAFARSGDTLVKVAWSKSSKSEYQHKAPRMVIKRLADSFAHHARANAVVSMDKILPLKADDGSQIPDYQVYVSLAWLRQIGAVKQNGRQGYTVKKLDDLAQKIDVAWSDLPEATVG